MRTLEARAQAKGIDCSYVSAWGDRRQVSQETLAALLGETDLTGRKAGQPNDEWESDRAPVPPVQVVEQGRPFSVPVIADRLGSTVHWRVVPEKGTPLQGSVAVSALTVRDRQGDQVQLELSPPVFQNLLPGYHHLELSWDGRFERPWARLPLHCVPSSAYLPGDPAAPPRSWALTLQLYSLRSERNWGVGDFTDLATLCGAAARRGISAIGLNPLHALFPALPAKTSPYSPSSRCFLNPIYLDVEAIPELEQSPEARALLSSSEFQAELAALRETEQVDYPRVWRCKRQVLERLQLPSKAFEADGDERLNRFALFEALHAHFLKTTGTASWREWPEPFRDPSSEEVARFGREHAREVALSKFLQWESDRQLGAAAHVARTAGMTVGLYRDVAVGVDPDGAEAWGDQTLLAPHAAIGAPPDIFNPKGQDWGLCPLSPEELRRRGYEPFIAAVRSNMRHAGAIRLDHVLGLKRLWWIPRGHSAAEGAYVNYPLDDLLGIAALESTRERCLLIGEDLGTVPKGFREELQRRGLLSYRVLMFERDDDGNGAFLPPEAYPKDAAVAVSTHDLATLKGFWAGSDLEVRRELELFPSKESADQAVSFREETRARLVEALRSSGELEPQEDPTYPRLAEAVHRFLARAPSRLMLVQLEDLLEQQEQMNLPGTIDQHPNWRRKLKVSLESLFEQPRLRALVEAIAELRPLEAQPTSV